jgi:hypothetical protein
MSPTGVSPLLDLLFDDPRIGRCIGVPGGSILRGCCG